MRILICCENFNPSIGGVQEVCYQLAKRFINSGNNVTVATSWHPSRKNKVLEGINIKQFKIVGNYVNSIIGEKSNYISFIYNSKFEVIIFYAAQQWTLDLLLKDIERLNSKKYLIPCGFSNLYNPKYKNYFDLLKNKLIFFDHIIFHTLSYRDYEFVKNNSNQKNLSLIPNGADENEFQNIYDKKDYKQKLGLSHNILIMTNGSLSEDKGLLDVLKSFKKIKTKKNVILYINTDFKKQSITHSIILLCKYVVKKVLGFKNIHVNFLNILKNEINSDLPDNLFVKIVNFNREDLINLYKASDIFIFASKIEYCPLVIYEAMASMNAIISHNVGNVYETLQKCNSGILVNNSLDKNKKSHIDINELTKSIDYLIDHPDEMKQFAFNGRKKYLEKYNWKLIFSKYQKIILK